MLKVTLCLSVAVIALEFASCFITCPDKSSCSDSDTCCKTEQGYACCPHPNAVCCSDLKHCCPSGYNCNLYEEVCEKQNQPWMQIPMLAKKAPGKHVQSAPDPQEHETNYIPEQQRSSVVRCDAYYVCPDFTTCCKGPTGHWACCNGVLATCCPDGLHCCPAGYYCDYTSTRCFRNRLTYPFIRKQISMATMTEASNNIPGPEGQCCSDGRHCCDYGYTCDNTDLSCKKSDSTIL
ncbi:progranulin-like isoform X2 [Antennarius striatus]|uniref:progranulin-like isoform X2 n=1 Tax=Antennarius striatus TaxID=241820 RepID=UPI0035B003A5